MTEQSCTVSSRRQWSLVKVMFLLSLMAIHAQAFHVAPTGSTSSNCNLSRNSAIIHSALFAQKRHEHGAVPAVRNDKHSKRRKKRGSTNDAKSISEMDVRQHVTSQYVHGPGGVFRPTMLKQRTQKVETKKEVDEHTKQLHKLDRHPALVLNADYQPMSYLPLSMWHWQEAVKAIFSGKVSVVDIYPDVVIRAATLEIPLPSVIALNEYVRQPNCRPAFTKKNVFLRDQYRCQYCSQQFHTRDLSLDHVTPRSMGGILSWENAVTSCRKCNGRKGSLRVSELRSVGMRLLREPYVPTQFELHGIAGRLLPKKVPAAWAPYLASGAEEVELATVHADEGLVFDDIPYDKRLNRH